jgi:transcriptional regulator with XRE-family HTH domain
MARPLSRAAVKLKELVLSGVTTQTEIAKRLGVNPSAISLWLTKGSLPSVPVAVELERAFAIPVADWMEEPPEDAGDVVLPRTRSQQEVGSLAKLTRQEAADLDGEEGE